MLARLTSSPLPPFWCPVGSKIQRETKNIGGIDAIQRAWDKSEHLAIRKRVNLHEDDPPFEGPYIDRRGDEYWPETERSTLSHVTGNSQRSGLSQFSEVAGRSNHTAATGASQRSRASSQMSLKSSKTSESERLRRKMKRCPWIKPPPTPVVLTGTQALQKSVVPLHMNLNIAFPPRTWQASTKLHYPDTASYGKDLISACTAKQGASVALQQPADPKYTEREDPYKNKRSKQRARRRSKNEPEPEYQCEPLSPLGAPGRIPEPKLTGTLRDGKRYVPRTPNELPSGDIPGSYGTDAGHPVSYNNRKAVNVGTGLGTMTAHPIGVGPNKSALTAWTSVRSLPWDASTEHQLYEAAKFEQKKFATMGGTRPGM